MLFCYITADCYFTCRSPILSEFTFSSLRSLYLPDLSFSPDALQSLAFLLCHTFARATKSVSIPAPVYCKSTGFLKLKCISDYMLVDAHLVCGKAKQHYDPSHPVVSDAGTSGSTEHERIMEQHKSEYKAKVHPNQENVMHWMVSNSLL